MADPRPRPTKLTLLAGRPGHKKINRNEPEYAPLNPEPPESLDDRGKEEWNRIIQDMILNGVLTKADEKILWAYCEEFSTAEHASIQIKLKGRIIKAPSGYPMQNPYISIKNKALSAMKGFAVELGLTPSARSRVQGKPTGGDDPYKKLKEQRAARHAAAVAKAKKKKKPTRRKK